MNLVIQNKHKYLQSVAYFANVTPSSGVVMYGRRNRDCHSLFNKVITSDITALSGLINEL